VATVTGDQNGNLAISSTEPSAGIGLPQTAFASLGANNNGVMIYCTDCKNVVDNAATAGAACVNGGSGAFAKRENNRWDCN
jgi:hypothetical protein